ncbi:MAG: M48 family metallopeptidase, partial [Actinomycetales bacterium]
MIEVIVGILAITFILEAILDELNQRSSAKEPDPLVADLYDREGKAKSLAYGGEKLRLGLISGFLSTALMILALTQGWFASLDEFWRDRIDSTLLISLFFIGSLSLISSLISLPFGLYSTFVIEEKYGFNKTTWKTFIADGAKGMLLSTLIGAPILAAVIWLYEEFSGRFWLFAWLLVTAVSIFMFMFGTKLILPLFNKLTPLSDGSLKREIAKYCESQGYSLKNLFVMDGSRRSTKANAFFSGMGRSKTIVLFDTLIEKLSEKEIVAVLAHEI